jgi:glycosyltransferase involved in cell wall biosynthesis
MQPDNVSYPFWHDSQIITQNEKKETQVLQVVPPILRQFSWGLRIGKGLICPSETLCNDWKDYIKGYPIHNYLDAERYDLSAPPLFPHDDIVIGWCGSMSHVSSFVGSGVTQALVYVARKYPNVRIMLTGDKRVYDNLNLPESKKLYSNFVPEAQWGSLLKSIDIGIAPLATEYDKRRSRIKVLEYMYMKVPWIASDFPTYREFSEYGQLTANGTENWKKVLCQTVENISKWKELANGKSFAHAATQTYDLNAETLLATYQKIIDSEYVV